MFWWVYIWWAWDGGARRESLVATEAIVGSRVGSFGHSGTLATQDEWHLLCQRSRLMFSSCLDLPRYLDRQKHGQRAESGGSLVVEVEAAVWLKLGSSPSRVEKVLDKLLHHGGVYLGGRLAQTRCGENLVNY